MGEAVEACRRMGEAEEAMGRTLGVKACGRQTGEEVGAFERKPGVEGAAFDRRHGEGEEEVSERSLGVEGEATGKKTSEEVAGVEEGRRTAAVGEAEGRTRWGEAGEEAPLLLQHCHWLRRSTESLFSRGASGNPGSDLCYPAAAGSHGACPRPCPLSSCSR